MTWTKLSDDFADDCEELSSDAFRLHVEGLVRSNRKLLNLRIDKDKMLRWVWCPESAAKAVIELLATGWWTEESDHYLIRHHGMYQRTREQVLKQQEVNQRNGKRGGRPPREQAKRPTPKTESVSESVSESKTERDRTGQDRLLREAVGFSETEDGFGNARCRYCANDLPAHMASQRMRGYCHRAACQADAKADLS
jgi:hypothetical protein